MRISVDKKSIITGSVIIIFLVIIIRLFFVQIIDKEYRINAENNALKYETIYPARGLILDRNEKILVNNVISYDINVTPYDVKEFDTVAFCNIFSLDTAFVKDKFREYKLYRTKIGYQTLTFLKKVSFEEYSRFIENAHLFPGFAASPKILRVYPYNSGGNLLGYTSEVDADFLKDHPDYKMGEYMGKTGMESSFESILKGEKGYTIYLRDAHNKIHENYANGEYDKEAVPGTNVITTIDAELQAYGESLMQNKVGSVVAIEPSTGDILAMISSPGINVSQLANISKYYAELSSDPYKPMFNRAVMSAQPPGSVFKLANGLIGLQEGVLKPQNRYPCHQGFVVGNLRVGCHSHASPLDLYEGIAQSCNAYFCYVFRNIIENSKYTTSQEGFEKWLDYVHDFGFGTKLGTDIGSELAGNLPSVEGYDKLHGKGRWHALNIISLSIGQGELGCTPLQLANFVATIANRGYYYTPHIQKDTEECRIDDRFKERHYTKIDKQHYDEVIKGMRLAVLSGTARIANIPGIEVCGKTGTAQNPHGDDHAVFACFAPMDNPQIAIIAYIENAGFGATWAAPIASLMVEKYLKGEISPERQYIEDNMMSANLLGKVKVK